jgi:GNAT superfamily N-acetyltransferase
MNVTEVTVSPAPSVIPAIQPTLDRKTDRPLAVEIREVTSRHHLNQFLALPGRIYADDPRWVSPLLMDVKEFLDPKRHPFLLHGEASKFLALRDGNAVGRILVSDDPHYNEQNQANLGCFGMFECINDPLVAAGLLNAAAEWLRARGRALIRGPIDYSTNYPCGLLVDGFDTPPRFMMNHGLPYYDPLLVSCGLRKVKDLYAWWFTDADDMMAKWKRHADWISRRGKVTVRPFSKRNFAAEVLRCHEVYDGARNDSWGYVDLTDAEFQYMAKRMAQFGVPEHVLLAEVDGKPVGFSVTMPDLNEAVRPLNGRLTRFGLPIGLARLMYRMRRVKTARMIVLCVLEEYRRRGIGELLILRTLDYGKNSLGYIDAELGWTDEDNYLVNRTIERVGAKRYKTYRIYEKSLV